MYWTDNNLYKLQSFDARSYNVCNGQRYSQYGAHDDTCSNCTKALATRMVAQLWKTLWFCGKYTCDQLPSIISNQI